MDSKTPLSRSGMASFLAFAILIGAIPGTAHATTYILRQGGWDVPPGIPSVLGIDTDDSVLTGPLNPGFGIGANFRNRGIMSLLSHTEGGGFFISGSGVFENVNFLESGFTSIDPNGVFLNTAGGTLVTGEVDTRRLNPASGGLRTLTTNTTEGLKSADSLLIGGYGSLENYGRWRDRGSTVVNGRVLNAGNAISENNPAFIFSAPGLPYSYTPYKQEIRIEHSFAANRGPAEWLNTLGGSNLTIGVDTTLTNRGEFHNAGTVQVFGNFQNLPSLPVAYQIPWGSGRFKNELNGSVGQVIVENGGLFWTGNSAAEDFVNVGGITVKLNGRIDGDNRFANQGGVANLTIDSGTLRSTFITNSGTVNISNAYNIPDNGRLLFTEYVQETSGITTISSGGAVTPRDNTFSRVVNYGTIQIDAKPTPDGADGVLTSKYFDQQGGLLIVNGTLNVPGELRHAGGDIQGSGTINGDTFTGGGVGIARWKPGNSPGTLTVNGNMTFDVNAVVDLEVELDAGGALIWDHLIANRMTFLAGSSIKLLLGPGTEQFLGESRALLTCSVACDFTGATLAVVGSAGADVMFGENGLSFTITPVPEPEAWAMLLAGLGFVAAMTRRRARSRTLQ